MRALSRLVVILVVVLDVAGAHSMCRGQTPPPHGEVQQTKTTRGVVVSQCRYASEIGRDILRRGGNAADAAVALAFALAVTWPEAGNVGGGGFMMIWPADGKQPVCVEYRETAPSAARRAMYAESDSRYSQKAVGVPGTVRGLELAHRKYGKLPWQNLVDPAAQLAAQGFSISKQLADSMNLILQQESDQDNPRVAELRRIYGRPDRADWREGDRLKLPDLSATLRAIAREGPNAFYHGPIAQKIVAEMKRGDGIIGLEDLASYRAKVRQLIRGTYRGYEIYGPPPPSSGGIGLVEALNMLEHFDVESRGRFDAKTVHIMAEVLRRCFRDRAEYLGDDDFVKIPDHLVSKTYARRAAASISLDHVTPSEQLAGEIRLSPDRVDTTHFSIVDADGMAVSNTYTLEANWGSQIVVRGTGILLNNEMGDFNWFPGLTDRTGHVGTEPNTIAPGKRMLSSQCPVFLAKDGKLVLVTGSPGGRSIISTVVCVIVNHVDFKMPLDEAVAAPRLYHQWFPDVLFFEHPCAAEYTELVAALKQLGHHIDVPKDHRGQGSAHSISVDAGTGLRHGVADFRRGGWAAAE